MADTYYADSSVLVKRHVQEIGSSWFTQLTDKSSGNVIITSSLSLVEVYSVLNRRRRELSLSAVDYSQITSGFKNICTAEYQIIEFLLPVSDRARLLLETYPLRAGDAIQLSSALIANATLQQNQFSSLIFLASDARLVNAAKAEGLAVDDPLLHS